MPEWNNYIMRKYAGSIRKNIYSEFKKFERVVIASCINKASIKAKKQVEEERLKDLPNIKDIKDNDFFKV